jgi:hypothetical protein
VIFFTIKVPLIVFTQTAAAISSVESFENVKSNNLGRVVKNKN